MRAKINSEALLIEAYNNGESMNLIAKRFRDISNYC